MAEYPFIETPQAVEELAGLLSRETAIAVDTEADSFFHYFEKLCLVQISASSGTWLIDPLALGQGGLDPLAPVFADRAIRKIFHAAEYDLFVLQQHGGLKVRNLFDTMVSAQLLGYPAVGLGALVERHLDIRLSKDQQRTDWSRRPLRPAQIEYAAADVLYLIEVSQRVERELVAKRRREWAQEEFEQLEKRVWPERDFAEQGYLKIKGARQLSPQTLAVLRELFLMRDRRARAIDRPPFKVLGNGTLMELATNPPRSRRTLAQCKGITELVLRRMGQDILNATAAGLEGPEHPPGREGPQRLQPPEPRPAGRRETRSAQALADDPGRATRTRPGRLLSERRAGGDRVGRSRHGRGTGRARSRQGMVGARVRSRVPGSRRLLPPTGLEDPGCGRLRPGAQALAQRRSRAFPPTRLSPAATRPRQPITAGVD